MLVLLAGVIFDRLWQASLLRTRTPALATLYEVLKVGQHVRLPVDLTAYNETLPDITLGHAIIERLIHVQQEVNECPLLAVQAVSMSSFFIQSLPLNLF